MDELMKMTNEQFIKYAKKLSKGDRESLKNLIKLHYERLVAVRASMVLILQKKDKENISDGDIFVAEKTYRESIEYMLVLESKFNILKELD